MKKHMTGFVPVDYAKAGKFLLFLATLLLLGNLILQLLGVLDLQSSVVVVGILCALIGIYLVRVVPKD